MKRFSFDWGRTYRQTYVPDPPMHPAERRAMISGLILLLVTGIASIACIAIAGWSAWYLLLLPLFALLEVVWLFCRYRARVNEFHDNRERRQRCQVP